MSLNVNVICFKFLNSKKQIVSIIIEMYFYLGNDRSISKYFNFIIQTYLSVKTVKNMPC